MSVTRMKKSLLKKKIFINHYLLLLFVVLTLFLFSQKYFKFSNGFNTSLGPNHRRYVIYECTNERLCGGWADRLKGIMSAYAWSLITDSYFLIHHNKPCSLVDILAPNKHDWTINYDLIDKSQIEYIRTIDNQHYRHSLVNYTRFKSDKNIISIRNNLDWLLPLSTNKNITTKLEQLGYINKTSNTNKFKIQFVFKTWYNELFKLNSKLSNKYANFLVRAKPNNQTRLICAQIRIGGKREFVSHDAVFTQRNNTKIYWNYIKNNFIRQIKNENYKIFITTDTKNVEEEARKEFGNDKIVINEGDNVHLDRENKCDNVDKVFLDFHCLQNCDMALVSESGYGKLGVWNRDNPNENFVMFSKKGQIIVKNSTDDLFIL